MVVESGIIVPLCHCAIVPLCQVEHLATGAGLVGHRLGSHGQTYDLPHCTGGLDAPLATALAEWSEVGHPNGSRTDPDDPGKKFSALRSFITSEVLWSLYDVLVCARTHILLQNIDEWSMQMVHNEISQLEMFNFWTLTWSYHELPMSLPLRSLFLRSGILQCFSTDCSGRSNMVQLVSTHQVLRFI